MKKLDPESSVTCQSLYSYTWWQRDGVSTGFVGSEAYVVQGTLWKINNTKL
jgi:hypothetical protein